MGFRHQLPAWSPVGVRTLAASLHPAASREVLAQHLRDAFRATDVALTASGTVALALAYRAAAPPRTRPRVALPAWACPDLLRAAEAVDAEVLLYDLDPACLAPDERSFRSALAAGAHAAVVAHWFGVPVLLKPFRAMAAAAGASLIDDAAQGVGAEIGGNPAGAGGDYGIVSYGRGKGRGGGGGGALLAMTDAAVSRLREGERMLTTTDHEWASIAALAAQWCFGRPWLYRLPAAIPALGLGMTRYHPPPALRSMGRRAGGVAIAAMEMVEEEVGVRRANAERWRNAVAGVPALELFQAPSGTEGGWLRFPVLATGAAMARLSRPNARHLGVSGGYPRLLNQYGAASTRIVSGGSLRGSQELVTRLFTLPTHRLVSGSDFHHILGLVQGM